MIAKNSNILYDKRIKRSSTYNEDTQQITLLDQRFYKQPSGEYYPSITYVLSYFPKGKFFESYLKDVGHNADIILRKAGEEGTQVHNAIEQIILGKPVFWLDLNHNANYALHVWQMIMKFAEFWETYKPELIALEYHIHSDEGKYAGTVDLICRIKDEVWIIDFKTSAAIQDSYYLQLASYKKAWEEKHDLKIDKTGILWLKASTRGSDKSGESIQGKGWQIKQSKRTFEEDYELFTFCRRFWQIDNPDSVPVINQYPTVIQLHKPEKKPKTSKKSIAENV